MSSVRSLELRSEHGSHITFTQRVLTASRNKSNCRTVETVTDSAFHRLSDRLKLAKLSALEAA